MARALSHYWGWNNLATIKYLRSAALQYFASHTSSIGPHFSFHMGCPGSLKNCICSQALPAPLQPAVNILRNITHLPCHAGTTKPLFCKMLHGKVIFVQHKSGRRWLRTTIDGVLVPVNDVCTVDHCRIAGAALQPHTAGSQDFCL